MNLIRRNFRRWWQVPRNIRDRPQHRQVTFLELFYDLVYVVVIAELTHTLASNIDGTHLFQFSFLFFIVWWAWLNGTSYHEVHGNDDIRTRLFTFTQMFTVAAMAIFVHDAFGETAAGFAIAYAVFQLILAYLWWRTGVFDPKHRPLSQPYTAAFLINSVLFIASAFVSQDTRIIIWIIAIVITIFLPFVTFSRGRSKPEVQSQIELSMTPTASIIERFGLFTIIVLGEVIVGVVQGVAGHHHLTMQVGVIGGLGMLVAIGLWWLYFDFVSHRRAGQGRELLWIYAHLSLTAGIATTGAAVLNAIEHAGELLPPEVRWLLVGAIAVTLASIALLIHTLHDQDTDPRIQRIGQYVTTLAAVAVLALGLSSLQTISLLVALLALLLTPIFLGFLSWLHSVDENTGSSSSSN